jgi:putative transposase
MTVRKMCELAGVSRAGFYRGPGQVAELSRDDSLTAELQKIAGKRRRYGYRRMTGELQAHGWVVNHKRVLALMRKRHLLCRRRQRWMRTTDSRHGLASYPNLTRGLKVSGLNQLWVADISYIPLQQGFAYLAVILDAHSRRVIGWALQENLEAGLTLAALRMALRKRGSPAGLVHHSDRGSQYACRSYVDLLRAHGIRSSMSGSVILMTTPSPRASSKRSRSKRCMAPNISMCATHARDCVVISSSTTGSVCIRRSAICRRSNSKPNCRELGPPDRSTRSRE